ncbi:MAG: hypothetical protein OXL40_07085, partial [Bacteroidota bacterium]|nr:hypothetical protein [Bacteroidota bacterium]
NVRMPVSLRMLEGAIELTFATALQERAATRADSYEVNTWQLLRSRRYGSERHDMHRLRISDVSLRDSTVRIGLPGLGPTWIIEIKYNLVDAQGTAFNGVVQGTIYALEK